MKNMMKRVKCALQGEDGASNVEILVWISVVLVIATVLFFFRDSIMDFFDRARGKVDSLDVD